MEITPVVSLLFPNAEYNGITPQFIMTTDISVRNILE